MKESINEKIFKGLKISEKSGKPVLFMANPGTGKTTTVKMYAQLKGYKVVELRGNECLPEEISGYPCAPTNVQSGVITATTHLRADWFDKVLNYDKEGHKVLLFLDEITTAPLPVQAALLKIIFDREVHSEKLPDSTLIVAAGNYSENLGSTMGMLAPTMNRFCIINLTPTKVDVDAFLCRFSGCSLGNNTNTQSSKIMALLGKLDSMETPLSEKKRNFVADYFERAVNLCTADLMSNKKLDLGCGDLQQIFSDRTDALYGFVSLRTLNYLVDMAIATYECFGSNGITSEFFKDVCQGLVGIGLTRKSKDETVSNLIGDYYYDQIKSVLPELDKLDNDVIVELEGVINDTITKRVSKNETEANTIAKLNLLSNKFSEILNDNKLKDLTKPVKSETLINVCKFIAKVYSNNFTVTNTNLSANSLTSNAEDLAGRINFLNHIIKLVGELAKILDKGYSADNAIDTGIFTEYKKMRRDLVSAVQIFEAYRRMYNKTAKDSNLLPELLKLN